MDDIFSKYKSMEIIIPLITFASGIVLAYIGFRFQISRDKLNTKRERLLLNIAKVERFLALTLEIRAVENTFDEIGRKQQDVQKEIRRTKKRHVEMKERYKEYEIKLKKLDNKKKLSAQDKNEIKSMKSQLEIDDKRLAEEEVALNARASNLDRIGQILSAQSSRLEEMLKELSVSDIGVVCKMIDPSNKLGMYLVELADNDKKLALNRENSNYIRKTQDLRYEIMKLLENKIK